MNDFMLVAITKLTFLVLITWYRNTTTFFVLLYLASRYFNIIRKCLLGQDGETVWRVVAGRELHVTRYSLLLLELFVSLASDLPHKL